MKLSIEQANKLLAQLAAGVAVAENEHEADADAEVDAILANISAVAAKTVRPALEEEMRGNMEATFMARYLGALRSAAMRIFNIPRREMENMTIEQILGRCKVGVDTEHTETEVAQETNMDAIVQEYEAQIERLKQDHEEQLNAERSKHTQRDIAARCLSLVERLPRKGGDLLEQADMLRYKMQKVYEVRYNEETKQLEFYKEGQPATGEANEPVTDEDFARSWAERAGILVKDTRHISPAEVLAGQQRGDTMRISTGEEQNGSMNAIEAWASQ